MPVKGRNKRSDDELLKEFNKRLDSSIEGMRPIMKRVERARKVAYGTSNEWYGRERDPADPTDWRSRFFPPIANEWWELMNAEMSIEDPRNNFTARDADQQEYARMASDALDYHNDRDNFRTTFRKATRAATRDGGAIIKTVWAHQNLPMFGIDGAPVVDEDGNIQYQTVHDGVRNILCKMETVFPDPSANSFDECRWVIHELKMSTEDLEARYDGDGNPYYSNLDELPISGSGSSNEERREGESEEAFKVRTEGDLHTIHEMWTPYGKLVVANRSLIIRKDNVPQPHGKVPFTMIRVIDHDNSIVGVSPMNLVDHVQESFWRVLNDTFDAMNLAINPPMIANTEEDPDADNYQIYPGAILPATNGEQTLKIMMDVANLSKYDAFGFLTFLRELGEKITGMNSALSGNSEAATATQAAIDVRQGKGRVGYEMGVADDGWCRVAQKSYSLIQNFMSEEVRAILTDGKKVEILPDRLVDMMISPSPEASERALKDLERQDSMGLVEMTQMIMQDPVVGPSMNPKPIYERFFTAFGVDADSVLGANQPVYDQIGQVAGETAAAIDAGAGAQVLDEQGNPVTDHGISEQEMAMINEAGESSYGGG